MTLFLTFPAPTKAPIPSHCVLIDSLRLFFRRFSYLLLLTPVVARVAIFGFSPDSSRDVTLFLTFPAPTKAPIPSHCVLIDSLRPFFRRFSYLLLLTPVVARSANFHHNKERGLQHKYPLQATLTRIAWWLSGVIACAANPGTVWVPGSNSAHGTFFSGLG